MNYALEIDDKKQQPMVSLDELQRTIREALEKGAVEIRLREDHGEMRGFEGVLYRVLGLSTEKGGNSVLLTANGEQCSVVILDANWNGYRVVNPNSDTAADSDEVSFRLSNGQVTRIERRYVIPTKDGVEVLVHFFSHGTRPPNLKYRRERS